MVDPLSCRGLALEAILPYEQGVQPTHERKYPTKRSISHMGCGVSHKVTGILDR